VNIFHIILVLVSAITGEVKVMQSEETWPDKAACEAVIPAFKADINAKIAANPQLTELQVQAQVGCMSESDLNPGVGA